LIELISDKNLLLNVYLNNWLNYFIFYIKTFWLSRRNEYPDLVTEDLKILISFAMSCLCEIGFSSMAAIKKRNRLSLDNDYFYVYLLQVLVGKPEGKRPRGKPMRRCKNGIRMDLREIG
jgi:hypothetical protein